MKKGKEWDGIFRLFKEAGKTKNPELARRYIKIAREIARKKKLRLPKELKLKFCRKCNSFFRPDNVKFRMSKGKLVVKCLECGYARRYKIK